MKGSSLLRLSGILEPLLVLGRLLPALVGRAGADQVDVGAKVFSVLASAIAGTVRVETEVVGGQLLRRHLQLGEQVAALVADAPLHRVAVRRLPMSLPFL